MSDLVERFWSYVDTSGGPDACHPWRGPARNAKGYGSFVVGRRQYVAHRWLLGQLRGEPLQWPQELGCHTCDNPPCCNPRHLYVGDHVRNALDAIERDRGSGASIQRAKTHCPSGHPYDAENTGGGGKLRYCKACKRIKSRDFHARVRRERGIKQRLRLPNGQFRWIAPSPVGEVA